MIRSDRQTQTHGDVCVDRGEDPIELLHGALLPGCLVAFVFVSSDVA